MFETKYFDILISELKNSHKCDLPVSAFIKLNNQIYGLSCNEVYLRKNHLLHAEVLAINKTLNQLNLIDFKGLDVTLYSLLEPCCMCLSFASLVRVKKVVYYAEDKKFGGVNRIYNLNSAFTKPEILFIEKDEVKDILRNFFKDKR